MLVKLIEQGSETLSFTALRYISLCIISNITWVTLTNLKIGAPNRAYYLKSTTINPSDCIVQVIVDDKFTTNFLAVVKSILPALAV